MDPMGKGLLKWWTHPPRLVYPHRTAEIYRVLPSDLHRWVTWMDTGTALPMADDGRFDSFITKLGCGFSKPIKIDI